MTTTVVVSTGGHAATVTTTPTEGNPTVSTVGPNSSQTFYVSPTGATISVAELASGATGQSGGGGVGIPPQ